MAIQAPVTQRAHEEAIAWFRARLPMTPDEFEALDESARRHAFKIAGVSQLKMVQSIFDDLDRAIANGESFDDFRRRVRLKLLRAWGRANPHRIEAIFRTETQKAYMAGRYRQLTSPAVKNLRPFWQFVNGFDGKSPICAERAGKLIAHQDDPVWNDNYPPLHVNCRSSVRALRRSDVERKGGPSNPLSEGEARSTPQVGFGARPHPTEFGDQAEPDLSAVDPELIQSFEAK